MEAAKGAGGDGTGDTVMATPEPAQRLASPTMSPQEVELRRLEYYIEQVEQYQENRYSKSFRNKGAERYEVEQVSMEEAKRCVDTADACSITYINIDEEHGDLDVKETAGTIGHVVRATMGMGGQAKGTLSFDKDMISQGRGGGEHGEVDRRARQGARAA